MPKVQIDLNIKTQADSATLEYGTESTSVDCRPGLTVEKAFKQEADALGFEAGRQVTYRRAGEVIGANTVVKAGETYTAAISHEQKGSL